MSSALGVLALSIVGLAACLTAALVMARRGWGAGAFFSAVYGVLYFIAPAYLAYRGLRGDQFELDYVANEILQSPHEAMPVALALLFAMAFGVAYVLASRLEGLPDIVPRTIQFGSRRVDAALFLIVIIGVLGYWGLDTYVDQYGGFVDAAAVAQFVRAGYGKDYQVGESVFAYRFADIGFVALTMLAASSTRRKIWAVILGSPFLIYIGVFAKGKANLLALAVVPFIYLSLTRKKSFAGTSLLIGAVTVVLVPLLQMLLFEEGGRTTVEEGAWLEATAQFLSHPHVSTAAALEYPGRYLYFNDLLAGLGGQLVPSSWLAGTAPFSSIEVNTEQITGAFVRMVPPGPVAFGYYSGGLAGVVIWAVVLALACATIDRLVEASARTPQAIAVVACLIFLISNGVYHGVPEFVFYYHRVVACVGFLLLAFRFEPIRVTRLAVA